VSDKLNFIFSRRSIRKFTEGQVPKADIEQIIKAGMAAPSAINKRPWHVTVITDPETRMRIAGDQRHWQSCKAAGVVLIVSGVKDRFQEGVSPTDTAFWQQDCSAATQNILLAATALGYGSLWMGVYPMQYAIDALKAAFPLPDTLVPFSLISIGIAGEEKEARTQYEEEQVTWYS